MSPFPLLLLFTLEMLAAELPSNETDLNDTVAFSTITSTLKPIASRPKPSFGMDLHCPSIENAVSTCPKDTNWVYYSCCGGANMYCCEHIQTWLLSALAVIAVILSIILIGCCVRCCCSYKRKTQQSYSFGDK